MNRRTALFQLGALSLWAGLPGCKTKTPPVQQTLQDASRYIEISPVVTADADGDTVSVVYFFHYLCPYCRKFDPLLQDWRKLLPGRAVLTHVPAIYNEQALLTLGRIYYSLEAIDQIERLHPLLYVALQDEWTHDPRLKEKTSFGMILAEWLQRQRVDVRQFQKSFDSEETMQRAILARQRNIDYKLDAVPALAVGGRFLTTPSQAGSYKDMLAVTDQLIDAQRHR